MPQRKIIEPLLLAPPTTGLLATLRKLGSSFLMEDNAPHWQQGMEVKPESCPDSGVGPASCSTVTWSLKDITGLPSSILITPFTVWAGEKCSTMGGMTTEELSSRAQRLLFATQSYQIANQLWTGSQAQVATPDDPTPYFASSGGSTVLTAAAGLDPTDALACLEYHIARCNKGTLGFINASVLVASHWTLNGQVSLSPDGILRTALGTIVIADAGYPGTAPIGVTDNADVHWAFASSPIRARLDTPFWVGDSPAEIVNRATNDIEYRYERIAAAWWEGCCLGSAGVRVDSCLTLGS